MVRVRRIDAGELARPVRRSDGSMVVQARIARTGVQVYRNADGSRRREYRPDSEVFAPEALASFKLIPYTLLHPPVMVTAENATQYSRGSTGETIGRDGKWVTATIAVHAKDAVDAIENGSARQISCGYDCDLEMTPGVSPDGEHFDCVQRKIRGNHVAGVPDARAGAEAAVRMDAATGVYDDTKTCPGCDAAPTKMIGCTDCAGSGMVPRNYSRKDDTMDTAQLTAALTKALGEVAAQTARADAAVASETTLKASLAKMEADRDAQRERADAADKARKDAMDGAPARVRARVTLEGAARGVLGKRCDSVDGKPAELDLNARTDREIKLAVIKHVTNADCALDAAGKPRPDEYIDARYDAAIERASASADTFRATRDVIEGHRADGATTGGKARADARAEMIKANREGGAPATAGK